MARPPDEASCHGTDADLGEPARTHSRRRTTARLISTSRNCTPPVALPTHAKGAAEKPAARRADHVAVVLERKPRGATAAEARTELDRADADGPGRLDASVGVEAARATRDDAGVAALAGRPGSAERDL